MGRVCSGKEADASRDLRQINVKSSTRQPPCRCTRGPSKHLFRVLSSALTTKRQRQIREPALVRKMLPAYPPVSFRRALSVSSCKLFSQGATHPMNTLFDILKKNRKGTFHWVESVNDIDTAEARLRQLSAASPDEFVIFRETDLRVVATYSDNTYRRL